MSTRPLLSAAPESTEERLQRRIDELQDELITVRAQAKAQVQEARMQAAKERRALASLRHQLEPLHLSLKSLFGELDAAGIVVNAEETSSLARPGRVTAVWDSWKQKLGGNRAAIIDALLEHGRMNVAQLSVATHTPRRQTIYDSIHSMTKLGLIDKSGEMFSLKEL